MARIRPALAVIAAATTPDERARAARRRVEEQPRGRGEAAARLKPSLLMGHLLY